MTLDETPKISLYKNIITIYKNYFKEHSNDSFPFGKIMNKYRENLTKSFIEFFINNYKNDDTYFDRYIDGQTYGSKVTKFVEKFLNEQNITEIDDETKSILCDCLGFMNKYQYVRQTSLELKRYEEKIKIQVDETIGN